jgi:hypothetical protein
MSADIAVTRRRKMLAFLVEQGGSAGLAEANQYSETKLLAAHQAFSAIMEGLVDGGYVTWDGTTFVVTAAGNEEAALAPKARARKGAKGAELAAAQVPPPPAPADPVAAVEPVAPVARVAVAPAAPVAGNPSGSEDVHDHGHSHDHGRAHDHGHSHAHGGAHDDDAGSAGPARAAPPRPRPTVEAPRKGLRTRAMALIRRLFAK